MTPDGHRPVVSENAGPSGGAPRSVLYSLLGLVLVLLGAQIYLIPTGNINWDEFLFLSHIYDFQAGRNFSFLQTFYVHFFGWLTALPGNEADLVVVGRVVMMMAEIATLGFLAAIMRRFVGWPAALAATAAYLGVAEVIRHGASFRADPLAVLLFVASCWALLKNTARHDILAAILTGLNVMITIKVALYAPTLLALTLLSADRHDWLHRIIRLGSVGALTIAAAAGFHLLLAGNATANEGATVLHTAGAIQNKVFGFQYFPALVGFFIRSVSGNLIYWAALLFGIAAAAVGWKKWPDKRKAVTILALALPILSLFIYRNIWPYFYVFILPTATVAVALSFQQLWERNSRRNQLAANVLIVLLPFVSTVIALNLSVLGRGNEQEGQRTVIGLVHRMFPEPVPYIDRSGLIASFPRAIPFMLSSWGLENYRHGEPTFEQILRNKKPPLLIVNRQALDISNPEARGERKSVYLLFDADYDILAASYVQFWGPIYVAGKTVKQLEPGERRDMQILIAGDYVLTATQPISINGATYGNGDIVNLPQGEINIENPGGTAADASLIWSTAVPPPKSPPQFSYLYKQF